MIDMRKYIHSHSMEELHRISLVKYQGGYLHVLEIKTVAVIVVFGELGRHKGNICRLKICK